MGRRILIVAGDPSGDHQAARLADELHRRDPALELYGYGGPEMAAHGVRVDGDLAALSAIGLLDVLPNVPAARRMQRQLLADVRRQPPDLAVLIDCGAFNLPTAKELRALGVPVLGYFPPGSWSGSPKRARKVAAAYSAVATPFPQPLPAYEQFGLPATLVGHPLVEELAPLAAEHAAAPLDPPVLALLPGSRRQEIRYILPPLLGAARLLKAERPALRVVVSRAPRVPAKLFDQVVAAGGVEVEVTDGSREAIRGATAAIVKSGTIALETMLVGVPMVVVYRASHLAYAIAGLYYWPRPRLWAMPNILSGELIVPQLFQYRVNPPRLAEEIAPLLGDTDIRRRMTADLAAAAAKLGGPGAVGRTADLVLAMLADGSSPTA